MLKSVKIAIDWQRYLAMLRGNKFHFGPSISPWPPWDFHPGWSAAPGPYAPDTALRIAQPHMSWPCHLSRTCRPVDLSTCRHSKVQCEQFLRTVQFTDTFCHVMSAGRVDGFRMFSAPAGQRHLSHLVPRSDLPTWNHDLKAVAISMSKC